MNKAILILENLILKVEAEDGDKMFLLGLKVALIQLKSRLI